MTDETRKPQVHGSEEAGISATTPFRDKWRAMPWKAVLVGAGLIAIGATGGAAGAGLLRPEPATYQADLATTPIADLAAGDRVALKGAVTDIFGNRFVVEDGAARALVETGPAGEDRALVAVGESVTVQGRFDRGFLHATAIRRANGEIEELAPPPPLGPKHDRW